VLFHSCHSASQQNILFKSFHLFSTVLGIKLRALKVLGKHSTTGYIPNLKNVLKLYIHGANSNCSIFSKDLGLKQPRTELRRRVALGVAMDTAGPGLPGSSDTHTRGGRPGSGLYPGA
jgi:hypothetical protein